jgi:3-oxoacyl-[acyl-carrier-protein] synthase-3
MNKAFIRAISYYLPADMLSNTELAKQFPDWSIDKIEAKTGIKFRRIANNNEFASDMAISAANLLFDEHNIDKSTIDFVLYCTQSPDYFLPTTACILQDKLGLKKNIGALDFNLGCSGYIYGLAIAKGLITSNIANNILLITSETYSKYINNSDRVNRTIFGDAAAATLVSNVGFAEILDFDLGTDGSGAQNLIVKEGGARYKVNVEKNKFDNSVNDSYLYMNGPEIFTFTTKMVPSLIKNNIKKNQVNEIDINLYILHQANKYMLDFLKKLTKIPDDKFFEFIEQIGNTVSSTIPIALAEAIKQEKTFGNVLLCGFGVGYSWGAVVIKFKNEK